MQKIKIEVPRATLDIYSYEKDELRFFEFDATRCQPPEPMVNTMLCLGLIENENDRLLGKFFHEPAPLYDKVADKFTHSATELESGDFEIIFQLKEY
ncbi:MAG: hypothetical protein ACI9TV_001370 [Sulfurimonas sp.]|jgi:hypothetical protein|uniref:hypothetical protein n=1 Tax=Sulfurimonas sp. TaxID=2022749 RepID=UPI0039E4FDDF